MLEARNAVDILAAQTERMCYLPGPEIVRKCRSYSDFSTVSDSTEFESDSQDTKEVPYAKRRAGSTESLALAEAIDASKAGLTAVPSIPELTAVRLSEVASKASSRQSDESDTAHECDGCCQSCTAERKAAILAIQRRFTMARAVSSSSYRPPTGRTDKPARASPRYSHAPQPLVGLFPLGYSDEAGSRQSGLSCLPSSNPSLIQPSSLIKPSPPLSSDEAEDSRTNSPPAGAGPMDASPPYSTACETPFMNVGPLFPLQHCSSAETISFVREGISPVASELHLDTRYSQDLLQSRGSVDSCVAASSHLSEGSAAEELFYRLNHARQTVDFVNRQASLYAPLNRAELDVWEALDTLDSLREFETALFGDDDRDAAMTLQEHALQTAEACRLAYPDQEWLHVVGLIHDLGKLLAHQGWGSEPQWAVCGETYPVGCRFHPAIMHSQFFSANPDRRRRAYSSATGMYQPGCGLNSVYMSWSAAEYLYMVLVRNKVRLPPEALFLIRYQRCAVLLRSGGPYSELLSQFDRRCLPWLKRFRDLARYTRRDLPGRLQGQALRDYYDALLAKYLPQAKLRW